MRVKFDFYFDHFVEIIQDIATCQQILVKEHNKKRIPLLKTYEALYYDYLGLSDRVVQIYSEQLDYFKKIGDQLNYLIIKSNLGQEYLYHHQYKEVITYFREAVPLKNENTTYFDLAWCYYNLGQMEACEKTIRQSVKAKTQYPAYTELLEWLSQMVKHPYSKTCLNSLLRIEKNYLDQLGPRGKVLVYGAISNHYQHEHNYEMANHYLKKIIQENMTTAIELN